MQPYDFLLDFFPLTDLVEQENRVLGEELQRLGLALLYAVNKEEPVAEHLESLRVMIRLCYDLGYVDDDIERYLLRGLRDIAGAV